MYSVVVDRHDDDSDVGDADRSDNSDEKTGLKICRICASDDLQHLLIEPCNCTGSVSHVHTECLERWIRHRHGELDAKLCCEICHGRYRILIRTIFEYNTQRFFCTAKSVGHLCEISVLSLLTLLIC